MPLLNKVKRGCKYEGYKNHACPIPSRLITFYTIVTQKLIEIST